MSSWIYPASINPLKFEGFVYLIRNKLTNRLYIGKRFIYRWSKRKRVGESDWKRYWGSSKELTADIEKLGVDNFEREIIHFCKTRQLTNYTEVKEQFVRDVLTAVLPDGSPAYYNRNILNRYFSKAPAPKIVVLTKEQKLAVKQEAFAKSLGFASHIEFEKFVKEMRGSGMPMAAIGRAAGCNTRQIRKIVKQK